MSLVWTQTGHDSKAALRAEAEQLIQYLRDHIDSMDDREATFMTNMLDCLTLNDEWVPTPKQLFWLRDLNVKY